MDPGFDFDSYWKAWIATRLMAIQESIAANKQAQRRIEQQHAGDPRMMSADDVPEEQQNPFEEEY